MTFTTPCFVRVENPEKRKELIEWLKALGYRLEYLRNDGVIVLTSENRVYVYGEALYRVIKVDYDTIDCGENTELFKALAAMNEWNDRKQWYAYTEYPTNEGKNGVRKFVFNEPARFDSFVDVPSGYYRKATAEEIVEYFKNKER